MTLAEAIFVAIVAGIATALMSGQLTPGYAPIVLLSLLAPAPLFVAGFAWHPLVAALGALVATLVVNALVSTNAALAIAGMIGLPAFMASILAGRLFSVLPGRPDRDGIDLGRVAMALIFYVAVVGTTTALLIEPDLGALEVRIRKMLEILWQSMLQGNVDPAVPQPKALGAMLDMMANLVLPVSALVAFTTLVLSGTFGMQIADRFGRLVYPRPDFRRFRLPGGTLILIGIALLVATRAGYVGLFGEMTVTMLALAFMLQGLAVLHVWTARIGLRLLVLIACWAALIIFGFPALVFIGIGMADHLLDFRRGRL